MKRFFLIDTISGRQSAQNGKNLVDDDKSKFYEQFSLISYVKSIELRVYMNEDDEDSSELNRIKIPLLVLEYGTLNLTNATKDLKTLRDLHKFDFSFKIRFLKRPNLKFFFQIILPILIAVSFFYALLQTFFYKVRQQKMEYDFAVLLNFVINLFANVSNALFAQTLMFTCYVFFVYKTQSQVMKIMLPLEEEEEKIGILLASAVALKVC